MQHDQPNLARIVDELAGDMTATSSLADLADDQLAEVGQLAIQRRRDDKAVIGQIAAEYVKNRKRTWRDVGEMLEMPYATLFRWGKPFMEGGA